MKYLHESLSKLAQTFQSHGFLNSRREAEDLICQAIHLSRSDLYEMRNRLVTEDEQKIFENWSDRRLKGEPLAYIAGRVEFFHCQFDVTPAVLIPRPETEILVDRISSFLKGEDLTGKVLLDLCCGSGCIGISLKKANPELSVYLIDLSKEACELAIRNAELNQVKVTILNGDLLGPFFNKKANYVVCNPPYISENEYAVLEKEVRDFEPKMALVGGESGLDFYVRLSEELPAYLQSHSSIWFEIGYRQGDEVAKIFLREPWRNLKLEKDWAGHHRFFFLENE